MTTSDVWRTDCGLKSFRLCDLATPPPVCASRLRLSATRLRMSSLERVGNSTCPATIAAHAQVSNVPASRAACRAGFLPRGGTHHRRWRRRERAGAIVERCRRYLLPVLPRELSWAGRRCASRRRRLHLAHSTTPPPVRARLAPCRYGLRCRVRRRWRRQRYAAITRRRWPNRSLAATVRALQRLVFVPTSEHAENHQQQQQQSSPTQQQLHVIQPEQGLIVVTRGRLQRCPTLVRQGCLLRHLPAVSHLISGQEHAHDQLPLQLGWERRARTTATLSTAARVLVPATTTPGAAKTLETLVMLIGTPLVSGSTPNSTLTLPALTLEITMRLTLIPPNSCATSRLKFASKVARAFVPATTTPHHELTPPSPRPVRTSKTVAYHAHQAPMS
jgi:hypothetical protein